LRLPKGAGGIEYGKLQKKASEKEKKPKKGEEKGI
jgi:hypothetical protein